MMVKWKKYSYFIIKFQKETLEKTRTKTKYDNLKYGGSKNVY